MAAENMPDDSLLTLVNVFYTSPQRQREAFDVLRTGTETTMSKQPGLISASYHLSQDGLRIAEYAQWQSMKALEKMLANPRCIEQMAASEKLLEGKDINFYDVVFTSRSPAADHVPTVEDPQPTPTIPSTSSLNTERDEMPAQIRSDVPMLTLVNVFHTTKETQLELFEMLKKATENEVARRPGFISANFHLSRDGRRLVNYAQWESVEALEGMLADPECQVHMDEAEKILVDKDIHYYDVIWTYCAQDRTADTVAG